jgi:hypothetical protein
MQKYPIGSKVCCEVHSFGRTYKWDGIVYKVRQVDEDAFEYWVTNHPLLYGNRYPLLAWEYEVSSLEAPANEVQAAHSSDNAESVVVAFRQRPSQRNL